MEQHYQLSLEKLLQTVAEHESSLVDDSTAVSTGQVMTIENIETHLDSSLFIVNDAAILKIYNYFDKSNKKKLLRTGEAAIFLDPDLKARLQVDALFRPTLHNIPRPSLQNVIETTDAETVLKSLEDSRAQNLLPLEKIRRGMESDFQCCHTEMRQVGFVRGKPKFKPQQCPNKAAAGMLRCTLHIGANITDKKSITALLLSAEEKRNSKLYWLMNSVSIELTIQMEEPHQRHPMSMDVIDMDYEKDFISFKILVEEMEKHYRSTLINPNKRFPESQFRMDFGKSGAHDSWEHAYHWLLFQIAELAPNQRVPSRWENYIEFIRFWTKSTGWFKYLHSFDEFQPQSEDSWVREIRPKPEYVGEAAHYNMEVETNTPEYFNYREPLEINPQVGVIENDQPLYTLDINHAGKLKISLKLQ